MGVNGRDHIVGFHKRTVRKFYTGSHPAFQHDLVHALIIMDHTAQFLELFLHPKGHLQGCAHRDAAVAVCHGRIGYQEGVCRIFLRQVIADHPLQQGRLKTLAVLFQRDLSEFLHYLGKVLHRCAHIDVVFDAPHLHRLTCGKDALLGVFYRLNEIPDLCFIFRRSLDQFALRLLQIVPERYALSIICGNVKCINRRILHIVGKRSNLAPHIVHLGALLGSGKPVDAVVNVISLPVPADALAAGYCIFLKYLCCKACTQRIDACCQSCDTTTDYYYLFFSVCVHS